jgi:AcrR family transcriptional regulator
MEAVETVLREKPVYAVSVADLAAAAGVSSAYLYTRFESKQALLDHVIGSFLEEQRQTGELIFASGKWTEDLEGRLIWLARQFRQSLAQHRGKIRALNEMTFGQEAGAWLELTAAGYMKEWLLACSDEIKHPEPEVAVTVVLQMMTLGLQASPVLNVNHPGASVPAEEIVRMALGYLTRPSDPVLL